MTDETHNRGPSEVMRRIKTELAALGEAPLEPEELKLLGQAGSADDLPDGSIAAVRALVDLGYATAPSGTLSSSERGRVWDRVRKRVAPHVVPLHRPQQHDRPANDSGADWRPVFAGFAAVAGLVLVVGLGALRAQPTTAASPEQTAALRLLGTEVRRQLNEFGEADRTARARNLAGEYAARLRGAEPQLGATQ